MVRVLSRDPGSANAPDRVEVARGDLSRSDTLDAVLERVKAVFLLWPFLTANDAPLIVDAIGDMYVPPHRVSLINGRTRRP